MTKQTQVVNYIIDSIQTALIGCHSPGIMMEHILDNAQGLVNDEGYTWDVALAISCKMYPRTEHCARYAYSA